MFLLWAVLNTSELFDHLILNTNLPLVGLFAGFVQLTQDNLIEIIVVKNYIEVLIVPFSMVAWMFGWCAPVLGIILMQYIRIKFMGSAFTKHALSGIDGFIQSIMPGFLYNLTMTPLKQFLSTLSGIKECLAAEQTT